MDPLDHVAALTRTGRFLDAFRELELCKSSNKTAANIRRVEILERLGKLDECRTLTNRLFDSKQLTSTQRATCHYVAGSLLLEQGDTEAATRHLQRAVSLARQSDDLELLCNVQLKFLGLVADLSGPDAAAPILSELRRNTIRLGNPYATAGVHVFVAQMEASRGLFLSAHRHLRIATGLTSSFQSPWLEAHSENIKLAICVLQSDIDQGQKHAVLGRRLADDCGAATIRRAVAANQALLYLLAGNFSDASESINRALVVLASSGERRNGCLDTLARIRLAEGRLDDCETALDCVEESIRLTSDQSMYANRYALFTRCQLLCRQGRLEDALIQARAVETLALRIDDRLLLESARLTRAELLQATGRRIEATLALEFAADQFRDFSPELYVQVPSAQLRARFAIGERAERRFFTMSGRNASAPL